MNPMDMLKNLQGMQSKMQELQSRLNDLTVTGTSGGDMVRVTINGQYSVLGVKIDPVAVDPSDIGLLEDLVLSAFTDASNKMKDKLQREAASLAGDIDLPPGMAGF